MEKLNHQTASFKDYENMPGKGPFEWADEFWDYRENWDSRGHWNYGQECVSGCNPEVELNIPGNANRTFVALVFNDYLGLAQHPSVKQAAIGYSGRC